MSDQPSNDGGGEAQSVAAPPKEYSWGTGRRKTSVARVRLHPGQGTFQVNGREIEQYFTEERDRKDVVRPLEATGMLGKLDVFARVDGGGFTGQAGAVVLGLARALKQANPDHEHALREGGFLTRDSRMNERKKYGLRGARRRFQFSKR